MRKFHAIEIIGQVLIYIGIFSLIANLVFGLKGGETFIYTLDKCSEVNVTINGSLPISEHEYEVLSDCSYKHSKFLCNCSDSWDFIFTPKINAVNNYTITFDYNYEEYKSSSNKKRKKQLIIYTTEAQNESKNNNETAEKVSGTETDRSGDKDKRSGESNSDDGTQIKSSDTERKKVENNKRSETNNNAVKQNSNETKSSSLFKWWMIPIIILLFVFVGGFLGVKKIFEEPPKDRTNEIERAINQIKNRR